MLPCPIRCASLLHPHLLPSGDKDFAGDDDYDGCCGSGWVARGSLVEGGTRRGDAFIKVVRTDGFELPHDLFLWLEDDVRSFCKVEVLR